MRVVILLVFIFVCSILPCFSYCSIGCLKHYLTRCFLSQAGKKFCTDAHLPVCISLELFLILELRD